MDLRLNKFDSSAAPEASPLGFPSRPLLFLHPNPEQFEQFLADLAQSIDPKDPVERLLTELLILAIDRLRKAAQEEERHGIPDAAWCRFQSLAERNFRHTLRELQRHRDRVEKAARNTPAPQSHKTPKSSLACPEAIEPEDMPKPSPESPPDSTPEEIEEASTNWRRHIALVKSVSLEWPILLRLGIEVDAVAAWRLQGVTEEELMSWYPGLTRADIAACMACDAEGLCGPFDPANGPYPDRLPVLDDVPLEGDP